MGSASIKHCLFVVFSLIFFTQSLVFLSIKFTKKLFEFFFYFLLVFSRRNSFVALIRYEIGKTDFVAERSAHCGNDESYYSSLVVISFSFNRFYYC